MMLIRSLILILTFLTTMASADKKILVVGDSMGDFSGASFTDYCSGAIQINRAIGGTTALQWRNAASEDTDFAEALNAADTMDGDDFVVMSLPANDFIPGCTKTEATVQSELVATIQVLKTAITNTGCSSSCPTIIMLGYVMPANEGGGDVEGCAGPASFAPLMNAIQGACAAESVTYVPILDSCGGTVSSYSPTTPCFGMPGPDNIHLNARGYCQAITLSTVQTALTCTARSYTCSDYPTDMTMSLRTEAKCTQWPCGARTLTRTITITSVEVSDWSDIQNTYEVAYGLALGLYTSGVGWSSGASVSSSRTTVAATTRRTGLGSTVTFTASFTDLSAGAEIYGTAAGLTATQFVSQLTAANTALSTSVTVPDVGDVTVNAFVGGTPSDENGGENKMMMMIGGAIGAFVAMWVIGGACYCCCYRHVTGHIKQKARDYRSDGNAGVQAV